MCLADNAFVNDFQTSKSYLLLFSLGESFATILGVPLNSQVVCKKVPNILDYVCDFDPMNSIPYFFFAAPCLFADINKAADSGQLAQHEYWKQGKTTSPALYKNVTNTIKGNKQPTNSPNI